MQGRVGLAYVGALGDQEAGQADRQRLRQGEPGELKARQNGVGRDAAEIGRQRVPALGERGFERHQHRLRVGELRLLLGDVGAGGAAEIELAPHGGEEALLEADQVALQRDLSPERGLVDGRRDHVADQGEVGRLEQRALVVGQRDTLLDAAPDPAPDIEVVGERELRVVVAVDEVDVGLALGRERLVAASAQEGAAERRQQAAVLREREFLGVAQRLARRLDARVVAQRLADQPAERGRVEQLPPGAGDVLSDRERLRVAAGRIGRRGPRRQCAPGVAGGGGRRRRTVVGPDLAGGETGRQDCEQQGENGGTGWQQGHGGVISQALCQRYAASS